MERKNRKGAAFWKKEKPERADEAAGPERKQSAPAGSILSGSMPVEPGQTEAGAGRRRRQMQEKNSGLKKNTFLRAARVLLWGMLIFLFVKGVVSSLRPDTAQEARQMIESFNRQLQRNKTVDSEICAFAQNFAREYLTYTAREEQEYRDRLQPYMGKNAPEAAELANGSARAVYTQAYRVERYSDSQWDVYVTAEVEYTTRTLEDGQTYQEKEESGKSCLKVPVYLDESTGHMIVEELPLFVNDARLYEEYARQEYSAAPLDEKSVGEIRTAVTNFLKAYCEQDETVIGYYLSQGADKTKFLGLDGRYLFSSLESLKCYQDTDAGAAVCIVDYMLIDSVNQAKPRQRLNLKVLKGTDGKYYIESIDARTGHLSLKG